MMDTDLFRGERVRLTALDTEAYAKTVSRWRRDSYFMRLLDSGPASVYSPKAIQEWMDKHLAGEAADRYFFCIRSLEDDRLLGDIDVSAAKNGSGETFVGIGLGEREFWGKGYGTDAMRIILRYAFTELNMHRVSLDVFEYNPRAVRSYEKAGFKVEGRERGSLHRDGRRWDMIYMGILRAEWEALNRTR